MDQHNPQSRLKINYWMVSTFILLGIIIGFGASQIPYFKNIKSQGGAAVVGDKGQGAEEEKEVALTAEQIAKLPDDDPAFGESSAPINIVEFSDFQCFYCGKFENQIMPLIEENYIKTGKARLVFRDFPLINIHPYAQAAAEAAECADEQGKFKEMHNALFGKQEEWSGDADVSKSFKKYAKQAGLDTKKFDSCVDSHAYASEVRKDLMDGISAGVNGTPAFFINGKLVSGALPYEQFFKPILEAELAGKKWEIVKDPVGNPIGVKVE